MREKILILLTVLGLILAGMRHASAQTGMTTVSYVNEYHNVGTATIEDNSSGVGTLDTIVLTLIAINILGASIVLAIQIIRQTQESNQKNVKPLLTEDQD